MSSLPGTRAEFVRRMVFVKTRTRPGRLTCDGAPRDRRQLRPRTGAGTTDGDATRGTTMTAGRQTQGTFEEKLMTLSRLSGPTPLRRFAEEAVGRTSTGVTERVASIGRPPVQQGSSRCGGLVTRSVPLVCRTGADDARPAAPRRGQNGIRLAELWSTLLRNYASVELPATAMAA
jgi:hypothetical protein